MKDNYGREIDYIRISVTDRCNLRCLYCMPNGIEKIDKEKILSDEDILDIVKEAVALGIKKVRITGGEPLVRKGIYELIQKINNIEGVQEIVLTTNGSLLHGHVKKLKTIGVSRVNLSIDSLNKETLNKISKIAVDIDHETLIQELIEEEMTPIKINTVLLKGINDYEVPNLIAFSDKYDLQIRFIELMPFEADGFEYDTYFISKDDIVTRYNLQKVSQEHNCDIYKTTDHKNVRFINAISSKFCEQCNRIRLTSDGFIKPCLHSKEELYIKGKNKKEVKEILKKAIESKPKQHHLDQTYKNAHKRSMNKIGG